MELIRVAIKNFRSIKDENIHFEHNCIVLLGKNEAGKSNVLKAIAAVFGKYTVSNKDKRKRIDNEKIDEYFVRAIYKLSEDDFKQILQRFQKKYSNTNLIKFKNSQNIGSYIKAVFYNLIIQIDIADEKNAHFSYWRYNKDDFKIVIPLYLNGNVLSLEPLANATEFNLSLSIFEIVKELFSENKYNCHYWEYSDNYLLPSSVNIASFISEPESIKGLENIFFLCKRDNIKKEFADALSQDGDYANLLEQVSKTLTSTFHKIWKDFKNTSIQLQPNGDEILIKVANKAKYSFEDRSEGFKKFISILLMLSTQSRANRIHEKDIILIDEPDQSLYPTSAQYLRDELLEMSKKSKIIYSTHCQYMIDTSNLERHYIVEKVDDITTIRKENKNAPFSTDELLRRAVGSSIFECLQPKNIIFEGYLDKLLFNKYCTFQNKDKLFKEYGMVYLGGISGAETLVQILLLANKKFVIVADSDETSKNKKADFCKNYPEYKDIWVSYADVCDGMLTMEDFVNPEHIETQIKKTGNQNYKYDITKSAISNIELAVNKDKEKKQSFKNHLAETLTKESIKTEYDNYINKLKEIIDSL